MLCCPTQPTYIPHQDDVRGRGGTGGTGTGGTDGGGTGGRSIFLLAPLDVGIDDKDHH